jgi:hypothetical protein
LLLPDNLSTLQDILLYHVVAGVVFAADLNDGAAITMFNDDSANVTVIEDASVTRKFRAASLVKINDSTVTMTDVKSLNGVIHVIDSLLLPPGLVLPAVALISDDSADFILEDATSIQISCATGEDANCDWGPGVGSISWSGGGNLGADGWTPGDENSVLTLTSSAASEENAIVVCTPDCACVVKDTDGTACTRVGDTAPPTEVASTPPTDAPVAPTEAPVTPATDAPVAPTDAPGAATEAPVTPATEAPVAPTEAPVTGPTDAPVAPPTEAPVTTSPVASTDAPVPTEAPVESLLPTPAPFVCNICGEGKEVTIPDGVVSIPTQGDQTCAALVGAASVGLIPEAGCPILVSLTQIPCGCREVVTPTTTPESGAPVAPTDATGTPSTAPTEAPEESDIGYCGDCYCIPDGDECPMDSMPETEFSEDLLDTLATITLENPILLSCNPYTEDECDAEPPLEKGKMCVAEIFKPADDASQCPEEYSYR